MRLMIPTGVRESNVCFNCRAESSGSEVNQAVQQVKEGDADEDDDGD